MNPVGFSSLSREKDKRGHNVAASLECTYDDENMCSVRVCRGQLPPVLNVVAQIAEAGSTVSGLSASGVGFASSLSPSASPLSQGRDEMRAAQISQMETRGEAASLIFAWQCAV